MLKTLSFLIFTCIYISQDSVFAQTYNNESLQRTYWNYRDLYRKYFTHIGSEFGKSIPFESLEVDFDVEPLNPASNHPNIKGRINYGDANITHGWYLAVLATEYNLLINASTIDWEALQACRNEIYYALDAINRIDKYSDAYYNPNIIYPLDQPKDGFLTRGDVTEDFSKTAFDDNAGFSKNYQWVHSDLFRGVDITEYKENWRMEWVAKEVYLDDPLHLFPPAIMTTHELIGNHTVTTANSSKFKFHTDWNKEFAHPLVGYDPHKDGAYGQWSAEMSQDHYTGLIFGLYFINEFVNNDYVKPTADDAGFKLIDEAAAIIIRLTDHFASKKTTFIVDKPDDFNKKWDKIFVAPWVMTNPFKDKVVARGPSTFNLGFSYPLEKINENIFGFKNWNAASGHYRYQRVGSNNEKKCIILNQENLFGNFFQIQIANQQWQRKGIQGDKTYYAENIFNFNMGHKLSVMSKVYDRNQLFITAHYPYQNRGLLWYVLHSVLNNAERILPLDIQFFDNLPCSGISNHNRFLDFRKNSMGENIINAKGKWNEENIFNMYSGTLGDPSIFLQVGEFNGLDFMLLHNLFRMYNKDDMSNNFENNGCPCVNSDSMVSDAIVDGSGNIINTLSTTFTTQELNKSYRDFDIPAPEWLTHNMTITGSGNLKVEGDLWVCNSTTTLQSSGTMTFTSRSHDKPRRIVYKKGSILEIKSGGILKVEDNTILVIEAGARMVYHPGARVILNGPNAVLKFNQGKLELKSGAEFKIEGGSNGRGYIHFDQNWVSFNDKEMITCEDFTCKVNLVGAYTDKAQYHNDLILKISGNMGLNTDWKLKNFAVSKGYIAIDKGSVLVSNAEYTSFWKCNINGLSNYDLDDKKHNGIEIPGRINRFEEVQIYNGKYGIKYYNRGGQENLKLIDVSTVNCNVGITLVGGGFEINKSSITGHSLAINGIGTSNLSSVKNSELSLGADGFGEISDVVFYDGWKIIAYRNNIEGGISGLSLKDAWAFLRCNTFNHNLVNLMWYNSPAITMKDGFNSFGEKCKQQIWGRGNTNFNLKDNFNAYLEPFGSVPYKLFEIHYSNSSPYDDGNNSAYGGNNSYYQIGGTPIDLQTNNKYKLKIYDDFYAQNPVSTNLTLNASPNLDITSISSSISSGCTDLNITGPLILKDYESNPALYTEPEFHGRRRRGMTPGIHILKPDINQRSVIITDTNDTTLTKPLTQALLDNYIRLYERSIPAFDTAINEMENILTRNTGDDSLSLSPFAGDMYFIYDMLNTAYVDASFYRDSADTTFLSMFEKSAPFYHKLDTVFQSLWQQSMDSNSMWFNRKYELAKDWSQVHRLANNKEMAIDILEMAIDSIDNAEAIEGFNKWICVNQFEIAMQADSSLSWDSAIALFPCLLENIGYDDSSTTYDTSIHYCNWDKKIVGYDSYATYTADSNLQSINIIGSTDYIRLNDTGIYQLKNGEYRLTYFDTSTYERLITNLTVVGDTQTIEMNDTTLSYCDWNSFGLSSYVSFIPSDSFDYTITNDSTSKLVISTNLTKGSYTINRFDINNCKIIRTKLIVVGDTQTINLHDTMIPICNMTDSTITDYIDYLSVSNLPYSVSEVEIDSFGNFYDSFLIWPHQIDFYDTFNCNIIRYNVTFINQNQVETKDTTISNCIFMDTSYSYTSLFSFPGIVHSILRINPDTFAFPENLLYPGTYLINVFDSIHCKFTRVSLTLNVTTPELISNDSTIVYCGQVNQIDTLLANLGLLYIPSADFTYLIKQIYPDSLEIHDSILYPGQYIVDVYDKNDCKIIRTELTITSTTPDILVFHDTLNSYCGSNSNYIAACDGMMFDAEGFYVEETNLDNYSLNPEMEYYSYFCLNLDSCLINKTIISFDDMMIISDTTIQHDTAWYACDTESDSLNYYPALEDIVMFDKNGDVLDESGANQYTLSPHAGYYYSVFRDTANCMAVKTFISFRDSVEVPPVNFNSILGMYDRTNSPCCFVNMSSIECMENRPLIENDEIEVYDMTPTFLFKTNLIMYSGDILAFEFCEPFWDSDSEHINDWYSIVFKSDTCTFCRIDFMCDTLAYSEIPMIINDDKNDKNGRLNDDSDVDEQRITNADRHNKAKTNSQTSISIFPNPANTEVKVNIKNFVGKYITLKISDASGRQVYLNTHSTVKNKVNAIINLNDLESGVYTIFIPELNYYYKLVLIK